MGTTNILDLNNRVSELAQSYPADKVMMSDGVTSVEVEIDRKNVANITAQVTGLTSYSSDSNPYTCPGDGYVRFVGTASTMATMYLLTADGTYNYTMGQTKDMYISIFVRKGAKVFLNNASNATFLRL